MSGLWARWVAWTSEETDARPLALVRVLLPLVLMADLLRVAQLGLLEDIFLGFQAGGVNRADNPWAVLDALPPEIAAALPMSALLISLALVAAGVFTRPALLVALLTYAQLGHIAGPMDRGIDRILRTVMLILLFSQWDRPGRIPAWPQNLVKWLLVLIYMNSGAAKLLSSPTGWIWGSTPEIYRIVANPISGHLDAALAGEWMWLWRLGCWFTIALELSAPLILTRLAPWWAVAGLGMHLGIAATMKLGMFSWGIMALYPILFARWFTEPPWSGDRPSGGPL